MMVRIKSAVASRPWLLIFFGVLTVYLCFLTKNYYWDGITFSLIIEDAKSYVPLIHPSHLIYNVVGYWFFSLFSNLGFHLRALTVLQLLNCVFGAAAAVLFFFISERIFRQRFVAVALTLIFSFSATWWKFATDADTYILSVLFLLVTFYFILPDQIARPVLVASTHTLAMCFHQLAIFFFPVVVLGIYFQSTSSKRKRLIDILQYSITSFAATFGLYVGGFYMQTGQTGIRDLLKWLTYYSTENGFVFNFKESLSYTAGGTLKLFFDGRFNLITKILDPFWVVFVIIAAICVGIGLALVINSLRESVEPPQPIAEMVRNNQILLLCLTWVSTYVIFLWFFIPKNTFYRLFYLAPLVVLIGILFARSRFFRIRQGIIAALAAIFFVSNFLLFIFPYSNIRKDTPLDLSTKMHEIWTDKSVIFYISPDTDNDLVRYFNPNVTWKQINKLEPEEIEQQLKEIETNGGDVWFDHSAFDKFSQDGNDARWFAKWATDECYKVNSTAYNMIFVRVSSNGNRS